MVQRESVALCSVVLTYRCDVHTNQPIMLSQQQNKGLSLLQPPLLLHTGQKYTNMPMIY